MIEKSILQTAIENAGYKPCVYPGERCNCLGVFITCRFGVFISHIVAEMYKLQPDITLIQATFNSMRVNQFAATAVYFPNVQFS